MVENQNTSNLELPYIIASQAQKHVTHNEALKKLDAIVQLSVISRTTIPETEPLAEGSRFIIPDGAEGIFSGMDGKIAISSNQSWEFYTPNEGWLCFVQDEGNLWIHTSNNWREANQVSAPDFVSKLGINATPDDQNRLSVNADATLLNNDGNGHQLKVNKSIETDTASCVFQTGFSGRAELGLVQSDNFVIRTSLDGNDWDTVVDIDNESKNIGLGGEPASTNFGLSVGSGLKVNSRDQPLYNLFQADNSFQITSMDCYSSAQTWHGNQCNARRARGTAANPESVQNGDLIYLFDMSAHNGQNFQRIVQERYFVDGQVNGTSIPVGYNLAFIDSAGIYRSRFRIQPNGNTGLGVYFPTTKLHVDGPVRVKSYSHTNLPPAPTHGAGSMIFVPDQSEGPCMAFSDGQAWRRMDTSAVI